MPALTRNPSIEVASSQHANGELRSQLLLNQLETSALIASSWRRLRRLAIACCVIALGVPTSAAATIVLGKSVGGVHVGESMGAVKHQLGKPSSVSCTLASPYCEPHVKFWNYKELQIFFLHGKVQALTSYSKQQRTSRGIGPGVSVARLKRAYPRGKVAPYSGAQGWWLPGAPTNDAPFTVFLGSSRKGVGGSVQFMEVGHWLSKYTCDFYSC